MLHRISLLLLISLCFSCAHEEQEIATPKEQEAPFSYSFTKYNFIHRLTNTTIPYSLFRPKQLTNNPDKQFPLIIALHGAEYFFSTEEQFLARDYTGYMALAWIEEENQQSYPAFVVAPHLYKELNETNRDYFGWDTDVSSDFVEELLDYLLSTEHIDPARVYITGHSMGGDGTWYLGTKLHQKIAAIVPLSSAFKASSPSYAFVETGLENGDLDDMGIWGFIHRVDANDKERGPSGAVDGSRALFKRMEELCYEPVYTHWVGSTEYDLSKDEIYRHINADQPYFYTEYSYPCQSVGDCHFAMGYALREDFLFDWLFQQRKD